jgi:integrase
MPVRKHGSSWQPRGICFRFPIELRANRQLGWTCESSNQERNAARRRKPFCGCPIWTRRKSPVLNSLTSTDAQRRYRHAIDEFVEWYCSEPRLSFNRTVVLRYRIHLESRKLAPGTINLRLGAVQRLAYEASDSGLLSSDWAAGIRRVKGVKKIGVRLGNWLLPDQAMALLAAPDSQTMKGKRDLALLAILVVCGLRRHEAVELNVSDLQQREDHWAMVDLMGKASHCLRLGALKPSPRGRRLQQARHRKLRGCRNTEGARTRYSRFICI